MSDITFECSQCSQCCRTVGKHVLRARTQLALKKAKDAFTRAVATFPFKFDKSGQCENLDAEGKCKIYDQRPDICSVAGSYKYKEGLTLKQWFEINARQCNTLIRAAKMPDSYLVTEKYDVCLTK